MHEFANDRLLVLNVLNISSSFSSFSLFAQDFLNQLLYEFFGFSGLSIFTSLTNNNKYNITIYITRYACFLLFVLSPAFLFIFMLMCGGYVINRFTVSIFV